MQAAHPRAIIVNGSRIITIILIVCVTILPFHTSVYADINDQIPIQGKLVGSDGTNASASCVLTDTCDFRFTVYDSASGGTSLWQEMQSNIEVRDGVWSVMLGSVTSLDDTDLQNFNRDDLYLEIEFDPDGDGDFAEGETFSPRIHFGSVPYAMNAKYIGGQSLSDLTDTFVNESGDTMTDDLLINSGGGTFNNTTTMADLFVEGAIETDTGFYGDLKAQSIVMENFTEGSVVFISNTHELAEDNNNFFWDDGNNRLGIRNNTPSHVLTIGSNSNPVGPGLKIFTDEVVDALVVYSTADADNAFRVDTDDKRVYVGSASTYFALGIGDETPGAHLVVGDDSTRSTADGIGDAYIQNDLEIGGLVVPDASGGDLGTNGLRWDWYSGVLYDSSGGSGSNGQVLLSTGSGVTWANQSTLDVGLLDGYDWGTVPDSVDIWVNESGDTMTGNLTIDKNQAQIFLGSGADGGPHGLVFADNSGTPQLQFYYRTSLNQLLVEHQNNGADIFGIDADTDYSFFMGRLGVNTDTPRSEMDVASKGSPVLTVGTLDTNGEEANIEIRGARTTSASSDVAGLKFYNNESGGTFEGARISMRNSDTTSGTSNADLLFWVNNGSSLIEAARIIDNGSIGVGTGAPNQEFHIHRDSTYSGNVGLRVEHGSNAIDLTAENGVFTLLGQSEQPLILGTSGDGIVWITPKYQVGVMDKEPDVTQGGITLNQWEEDAKILSMQSSDITHGMTTIAETDVYGFMQKFDANYGGLSIEGLNDGKTIGLSLTGTAVDEDTATSTSALGAVMINSYVKNGTGRTALGSWSNLLTIRNGTTTRFIFKGSGRAYADVGWYTYSDKRVKEDIQELNYGLDTILALQPVSYYKHSAHISNGQVIYDNTDTEKEIGLIAQDVAQIVPEAVSIPLDDKSLYAIDYSRLVPVLIEAIQEQQVMINQLGNGLDTHLQDNKLSFPSGDTIEVVNDRLLVNGVEINSGVTSNSHDGLLKVKDLQVGDDMTVASILSPHGLTISGNVSIAGELKISDHLSVGHDTAGEAIIPAGKTEVVVEFDEPYEAIPVTVVTPVDFGGNFYITDRQFDRSTIVIDVPYKDDVLFTWIVMAVE